MNKIKKIIFGLLVTFIFTISVSASSAKISVSSSTSKIVVGNTFTVTIKISSSSYFGTWEFTPSYDTSKLKMTSGSTSVKSYGKKKSVSYTYKFKAIGTGTAKITVKSAEVLDYNEEKPMSLNKGTKSVKIITQKELEASYSKNNYLKSLSVDGLKLSPSFKKDTLEYTVEANSNTTSVNIKATAADKKSSISGKGKHNVGEGENLFKIVVKAQNGSTRTYKIKVNVIDPNPIIVNVDGKDLTVVKRESVLNSPEDYEKTTIKINDIDVPAFYNETNNFTLVGLKDSEETNLYIYDSENNIYSKYVETKLSELDLYPLEIDKDFGKNYESSSVEINSIPFKSLKLSNSDYHIIHARNLLTGENNYYLYDSIANTAIRYMEEKKETIINTVVEKKDDYKNLVIILASICGLLMFITLFALISKNKSKKQLRKLLNMIEEKQRLAEEKKKQKELESVKEITEDENKNIKPKKTTKKKTNKK